MYLLAEKLNVPLYAAVGILDLLWEHAARYSPRGDIGSRPDRAIAEAVDWDKEKSEELITALVDSRWVDRCKENRLVVHDWPDHCERSVTLWLKRNNKTFLPVYAQCAEDVRTNDVLCAAPREARAEAEVNSFINPEKENKSSTRASVELVPHPEAGAPEFQTFLAVFAGLGVELSQHDADKTCRLWISLEPAERVMAYYYARDQAKGAWGKCAKQFVPRPWNYVLEKHWTRLSFAKGRDSPATKGETAQDTAARMFRKRQEESSI